MIKNANKIKLPENVRIKACTYESTPMYNATLIHFVDRSVPIDCSPFRILRYITEAADDYKGLEVTIYKDPSAKCYSKEDLK